MTDALYNTGKNRESRAQVAHPLIDDGLKLIPSVTRVFSQSRDLYIYLQAYERDASVTQPLAIFVKFYREGEPAIEIPPSIVKEGLDVTSKAVPMKLTIPLNRLRPGEYTCQITVLATSQKAAFWQAPIRVVP